MSVAYCNASSSVFNDSIMLHWFTLTGERKERGKRVRREAIGEKSLIGKTYIHFLSFLCSLKFPFDNNFSQINSQSSLL